jgi:4-carboxymuconolactone decarboxylase
MPLMPHQAQSFPHPDLESDAGQVPVRIALLAAWRDPGWISQQPATGARLMDKQAFDKGMKLRREVLGDEHVDRSMATADGPGRALQDLLTQYAWGEVWSRPGLDRKARSMITLAMLAALNRPHELKLHVHAALRNGLASAEIGEIFLQAAVYAGGPAALDAFRVACEAFKEAGIG